MMNYLKMFEEFQSGLQTDTQRFLMYVPEDNGAFQFAAVAESDEEMLQVDKSLATQYPDRVWYQFDLTKSHPAGGTLINKRIVKGPPNSDKYINDPDFEFDTPINGEVQASNFDDIEDIPTNIDLRSPASDEQPWLNPSLVGDLRT